MRKTLFLYHVAANLIEQNDRGTARGEQLEEYDKADGKISFLGPKKLFEEFRVDEFAMKIIRDRHLEYTALLPL